jgi:outer membrane protein OmpA-like peptidoglycan-associated protein
VSNKEGDFNIYKVAVESDGEVGVPIKLSSSINSSSNETTPFILNNTLYFSSDRSGGLGGFDIYSIDLNNPNSKISRIQDPINSTFDDTNFIKKNSNEGFFVSNRPGGKGKEDIYYFKENNEDNLISSVTKTNANKFFQDEEEKMLASNKANKSKVNLAVDKKIESKTVKSGSVVDNTSTVKVQEKIKYVKNDNVYDYQRRDSYDIQKEKVTVIEALNTSLSKKDKSKDEYSKCQMEFDKINNIYFDYSEAYIREDAAIELDKVIRVLRLCPKIVLQASSHTDSRASSSYNLKLSQDRANSVVKYILRNGKFSPDRIVSKGYGEERLANKCSDGVKCTEKEHQLNRRTHFEIYNY